MPNMTWIKPVELPSGHEEPCPMCGIVDDRDPSKNRLGTGKVRHDFINRYTKIVNKVTMLPGVALVEYPCEVCEGTGAVWINDETKERTPSEQMPYVQPKYQRMTEDKYVAPTLQGGCTLGTCRSCHQIKEIDVNCYCVDC